jgi:hypothetical protein
VNYFYIFCGCFALSFVMVNANINRKNNYAVERLRLNGVGEEGLKVFRAQMNTPATWLVRFWASFVFAVLGAIPCALAYWVFT